MKRNTIIAAALMLGLAACSDTSDTFAPQMELVDPTKRVADDDVNAWVYGSFSITFEGAASVLGGGAQANFPGNPKNAGTCGTVGGGDTGVWYNPQGKRTAGSETKPHPHCVGNGGGTVTVVLEPISVHNGGTAGTANEFLQFALEDEDGRAHVTGSNQQPDKQGTQAQGILVAYAIDASTLGTTNKRVGILTIDLGQYDSLGSGSVNYFETGCTIDGVSGSPRCLNKIIQADYEPLPAPDGVGHAIDSSTALEPITGFLYWSSAETPFNY